MDFLDSVLAGEEGCMLGEMSKKKLDLFKVIARLVNCCVCLCFLR